MTSSSLLRNQFLDQKKIAGWFLSVLIHCLFFFPMVVFADVISLTQSLEDGVDGADGLAGINSITVSPDGEHVYVASEGDFSIALYQRNTYTGNLSFIELYRDGTNGVDGLEGAFDVLVSADGKNVYATGATERAVVIFTRNTLTGQLTYSGIIDIGSWGSADLGEIAQSPDGNHVYVATESGNNNDGDFSPSAIIHFSRSTIDGSLESENLYQDEFQVDSLDGGISMTITPDGKNLYATAYWDSSLVAFSRNTIDGTLTVVETEIHRDAADDGLFRPNSVLSSSDGELIYALSDQLAAYDRDPNSGEVDFLQIYDDDDTGYFNSPQSLASTPNGLHVIVGLYGGSIIVFERNLSTNQLQFVQRFDLDRFVGVVNALAISPDGKHIYVGQNYYDSLDVLSIESEITPTPFIMNPGLNDAWYFPDTDGQGFFIIVFPDIQKVLVSWFTYDTELPPEDVVANLGDPGHRWLNALGSYSGNEAELTVKVASGGIFDTPTVTGREVIGTIRLTFAGCNSGTVEYDFTSIGRSGVVPIERIVGDNIALCEAFLEQ